MTLEAAAPDWLKFLFADFHIPQLMPTLRNEVNKKYKVSLMVRL